MGERCGYRVKEGNIVSDILRKQWWIGGDEESIKKMVKNIASILLSNGLGLYGGDEKSIINGGFVALRHDLDIGRLTAAMFASLYKAPFDSIEKDINCDISDNGLFEIELVKWNYWKINHYPVELNSDTLGKPKTIAAVYFKSDETLEKGMEFRWYGWKGLN